MDFCVLVCCKIRGGKANWHLEPLHWWLWHSWKWQSTLSKTKEKTENKVKIFYLTGLHSTTHTDTWVGDTIIKKKFSFN